MTKQIVHCPICTTLLGKVHGQDVSDLISRHIIYQHPQVAKNIVEIALKIEKYKAEFKRLSGMNSRDALYDFTNQNTMRTLGFSEKEIDEHLKGDS